MEFTGADSDSLGSDKCIYHSILHLLVLSFLYKKILKYRSYCMVPIVA